jgi:hypothetical protein
MKRFSLLMVFILPGRVLLADPADAEKYVRIYAARYHVPPTFVAALIDGRIAMEPTRSLRKGSDGLDATDAGDSPTLWRI